MTRRACCAKLPRTEGRADAKVVKEVKGGRCSWGRVERGDRDQVKEGSGACDQLVTCDCGPGSHGDL